MRAADWRPESCGDRRGWNCHASLVSSTSQRPVQDATLACWGAHPRLAIELSLPLTTQPALMNGHTLRQHAALASSRPALQRPSQGPQGREAATAARAAAGRTGAGPQGTAALRTDQPGTASLSAPPAGALGASPAPPPAADSTSSLGACPQHEQQLQLGVDALDAQVQVRGTHLPGLAGLALPTLPSHGHHTQPRYTAALHKHCRTPGLRRRAVRPSCRTVASRRQKGSAWGAG